MCFGDNAASIAQLTGLQHLEIFSRDDHGRVTAEQLLQITALQQLTYLLLSAWAWHPQLEAALEATLRVKRSVYLKGGTGFTITVR